MDIDSTKAALNHLMLSKAILQFDLNVSHEDLDTPIADLQAQIAELELAQKAQSAGIAA